MPILITRILTIVIVPFLALFGLLFFCVRKALAMSMHMVGWELAWPPVLADDCELENSSSHSHRMARSSRI